MPAKRSSFLKIYGFAAAAVALIATSATAQDDADQVAADDEVIDEIVVIAGEKSGDPVDVDALYEEMMRERLMIEDIRLHELEEQNEWRNPNTRVADNPSRMSWGYDPKDELRMRRESNMSDAPYVTTKPATIFRSSFE